MEDSSRRAANTASRLIADDADQPAKETRRWRGADGSLLFHCRGSWLSRDRRSRQDEHSLSSEHDRIETSYLRANRDQATRVLKAYVEGIAYFKKNKKDSVRIILKKMRMDADQAKYAERTYDQYAELYFDRIPYPSPTGIKTVLESLAKDNPKAKGADPSSFTDPSILKSIEDSGFIKSLYE